MPTVHPTRRGLSALCALLALGALGLSTASPSLAASKARARTSTKGAGKPKFDKGSGETVRERERRLLRECKGRPNAGACEGFAS